MGRRSSFERIDKDFYSTPRTAVEPLLPHLAPGTCFVEPCAGDGRLIRHLQYFGHKCVGAFDIEPRHPSIKKADARRMRGNNIPMWLSNLPWSRNLFHPIIDNLAKQAPLWTIVDGEWVHTIQAREYMPILRKIVSIGRVNWIEGTDMSSKDSAIWVLLDATRPPSVCEFYGR